MTLFLPEALQVQVQEIARNSPGEEVCGLLLGWHNKVEAITPCANVAENPAVSFELDPAELIAAHRVARDGGAQVIGHYHSHPNGRVGPSACDEAASARDGSYWIILSTKSITAWRATEHGLLPTPILPC